jgi:hypothetical protein
VSLLFFTELMVMMINSPYFLNFDGNLDGTGTGPAQLYLPPLGSDLVGFRFHFAFMLTDPSDYASNPVEPLLVR